MNGQGLWTPVTTVTVAEAITVALARDDEPAALRCAVQLLDDLARVSAEQRPPLVRDEPPSTGDARWDALLAGVVELACHRHGLAVPGWTVAPERLLDRWWFAVPTPGLAASAFAEAPAALANRGVFLHASSLQSR